jgi:CubicO group peptidase (beta-lactamase class C family)
MVDTDFCVRKGELNRFAAMYGSLRIEERDSTAIQWFGRAAEGVNECLARPEESREASPHSVFRGGHGLVSTAADYLRFAQMMLGNGALYGTRILSRKTVELMTTNHLPPNLMPYELQGMYSPGRGYGLGVETVTDLGQSQILGSVGTYGWSGAASTHFWVDPQEELIGIQMAQFQPGGFYPIDMDFRVAAYQAIVD